MTGVSGCIFVHHACVWGLQKPKTRMNPLELELLSTIVSHYLGSGTKIWVFWESNQYFLTAEPPV